MTASTAVHVPHWLDRYATGFHSWREGSVPADAEKADRSTECFYRQCGLVELSFRYDGLYFEGRADINCLLDYDIRSGLTGEDLRHRILLCWTILRARHVILLARLGRTVRDRQTGSSAQGDFFVIPKKLSVESCLAEAAANLSFIDDDYPNITIDDFYTHAQNTARVVGQGNNGLLSRLFVRLPTPNAPRSKTQRLSMLLLLGHEISDGMTNLSWSQDLQRLLNSPISALKDELQREWQPERARARLPSAQEDLYPPLRSAAVSRWFWAITRVLRHVHQPPPAAMQNPLRRDTPLTEAALFDPAFSNILDYSRKPPLNSYIVRAQLSKTASKRLQKLCKEAGVSTGSGCFVLVGMVMMALHEERYPHEAPEARKPFIGSFPVNPRQFFNHQEPPDSCMLAFSEGVILPFLPSHLDLDARFRLLARQAQRQLSRYQKRPQGVTADPKAYMAYTGPGRVIAGTYLMLAERAAERGTADDRERLGLAQNPQGRYLPRPAPGLATCGVSSVGRSPLTKGSVDLSQPLRDGEDAFIADINTSTMTVRPRDGEFLVAIWGDREGTIGTSVSYDGNAIDPARAMQWKAKMESLLEVDSRSIARL